MKQNTYEAIKLIEQITASRYYTERGRAALIDTVANAMFLSAHQKDKLLAAQQTQYDKLQDVRNALLLLGGTEHPEEAEAVLRARSEVLATQQQKAYGAPYSDKSGWLVYVKGILNSRGDAEQQEAAVFLAATNHCEEALERFANLADRGDLVSLWMALGLAVKLGKKDVEAQLLGDLVALYDDGVIDYLPDEAFARRKALEQGGYSGRAGEAVRNKIGF